MLTSADTILERPPVPINNGIVFLPSWPTHFPTPLAVRIDISLLCEMPFPDPGTVPLSNKDVLSYVFDAPTYDVDKPVFIDPRDPSLYFSHRTAKELVQKLIAGFHAAGLQPGDTVCIHSFNSITYALLVLAVIGAGGLSVGTNPSYTRGELNHAIKVAKVKFVLAEPEIMDNMVTALKDNSIDIGERLFVLDSQEGSSLAAKPGLKSWRCLTQHGKRDWIRFDDEETSANTVAQLYYTSGTTGLPKCAMITHRNLTSAHEIFFEIYPLGHPYRLAMAMPAFHMGIQGQFIISALKQGRDAYVMRRFELESFLRYHSKYQLTVVFAVPPMINAIVMSGLADPNSKNYKPEFSLKTVLFGTAGAAPMSGDMQQRFNQLIAPGGTFRQIWGMTETSAMATKVPDDIANGCIAGRLQAWGSVGAPLRCVTMKLVDEVGRDVTEQGTGEICIKAPTVCRGYFENEKATRESWDHEGYFKTGDIARVDSHGMLYIIERSKELIKVRGFQCAPAELEGALTEHPDITDAAVIGVTVSNEEEAPKAFIVRRPGSAITSDQVHAHMRRRVAGYKQLTGGIEFVKDIPKLPSGKILKRVLREQEKKKKKKALAEGPKL